MYIQRSLRKLFNLYPGEGPRAFALAMVALLSSFGAMGGATLLDGQFLEQLGPQALPITYLWTAGTLIAASTLLLWGLRHFSSRTFFTIILIKVSLFYAVIAFVTALPLSSNFWIFYKVVADVSILLTLTGLWTLISRSYDLQDTKRLVGLFSASLILGAAAGSGWVALGLPQVETGGLAATFAVALFAASLLLFRCPTTTLEVEKEPRGEVGWKAGLRHLFSSRFTLYLILFNILLGLIEVVCEFDYMATLTSVFGATETSGIVTRFLGRARAWVYVGDMVFGMFVYGRLIKRVGINNASLLSAGYFLALFLAGPPLNGLFIAFLGLIAVEGVLPALEDSNFNLLLSAIPQRVQNQYRIAIEYILQPAGMLGASLLLVLFHGQAKVIGLGLACLAVAVAYAIRKRYPTAIYNTLKGGGIPFGTSISSYIQGLPKKEQKRLPQLLLEKIPHLSPPGQLAAFECLLHMKNKGLLIASALQSLAEPTLSRAFDLLSATPFAKDPKLLEALEAWETSEVHRGHALLFLASQGRPLNDDIGYHLASDHLPLRGAAILTLLSKENDARREVAYSLLQRLIASDNDREVSMGLNLLGTMGQPRHTAILRRFLHHPSPEIAAKACLLLGGLVEAGSDVLRSIAQVLISRPNPVVRRACLKVLDNRLLVDQVEPLVHAATYLCPIFKRRAERLVYQLGAKAAPILTQIASNPRYSHAKRLFAGRIWSQIALPSRQTDLYPSFEAEIRRSEFSFYHYHAIEWVGDEFTLLREALWQRHCDSIDLVIHLLCPPDHDAHLLCRALRSGNEKSHSHAVETIEKLCPTKLTQRLLPLIDDRPVEDKIHLYKRRGSRTLTLPQLLDEFHSSPYPTEPLVAGAIVAKQMTAAPPHLETLELAQA